jgi:hypothetical protein
MIKEDKKETFESWWKRVLDVHDYAKDPNDPKHYYDYKSAYRSGYEIPEKGGHWPSQFKHDLHPNRYIKLKDGSWLDSKYNKKAEIEDVIMQRWDRKEYEKKFFK